VSDDLLPVSNGLTDDEARLRDAINRTTGQMMAALDASLRLRTAAPEAQRARHIARGHLLQFALTAMHAAAIEAGKNSDTEGKV